MYYNTIVTKLTGNKQATWFLLLKYNTEMLLLDDVYYKYFNFNLKIKYSEIIWSGQTDTLLILRNMNLLRQLWDVCILNV